MKANNPDMLALAKRTKPPAKVYWQGSEWRVKLGARVWAVHSVDEAKARLDSGA